MSALLAALGGTVVGSAAGTAAQRWPRDATLASPVRSSCEACGLVLGARDLVPILSWVRLGGRCRRCHARIPAVHPVVELTSGLAVGAIVVVHGPTLNAVLLGIGAIAVIVASVTDLQHRIIPDRLTLPLAVLATLSVPLVVGPGGPLVEALAWSLGVPVALRALVMLADVRGRPRPIGAGDIKLLVGVLGLAAGVQAGALGMLLVAVLTAGGVALIGLATGRLHRRSRLPFGPAIATGYLVGVIAPGGVPVVTGHVGGVA